MYHGVGLSCCTLPGFITCAFDSKVKVQWTDALWTGVNQRREVGRRAQEQRFMKKYQ